jgi:F420-non-reducing hydrogenase iron-sulfur subunit
MEMSKSGSTLPYPFYSVRVMCSGRVDPAILLYAFEKGAAGIMVIGCKDKACRYGPGPKQGEKIEGPIRKLMHVLGIERERLQYARLDHDEGPRLSEEIKRFAEGALKLGPSPFILP